MAICGHKNQNSQYKKKNLPTANSKSSKPCSVGRESEREGGRERERERTRRTDEMHCQCFKKLPTIIPPPYSPSPKHEKQRERERRVLLYITRQLFILTTPALPVFHVSVFVHIPQKMPPTEMFVTRRVGSTDPFSLDT